MSGRRGEVVNLRGGYSGVEPPTGPPHDSSMEARVAVLEQVAKDTREALGDIRAELRTIRDRQDGSRDRQERDFRLTWGALIFVALGLAALMAKGFRWL